MQEPVPAHEVVGTRAPAVRLHQEIEAARPGVTRAGT